MDSQLAFAFTDASVRRLQQFSARIGQCAEKLTDDQIWMRGSENENAVGNLMLHLAGNVRQWIISSIGGAPDARVRDQEFAARGDISKEALIQRLKETVEEASLVILALTPQRLLDRVQVQAYNVTVLEAVLHVVEHFALHTGQIIFATKLMTQQDLGFYRHIGAAAHAEKTP